MYAVEVRHGHHHHHRLTDSYLAKSWYRISDSVGCAGSKWGQAMVCFGITEVQIASHCISVTVEMSLPTSGALSILQSQWCAMICHAMPCHATKCCACYDVQCCHTMCCAILCFAMTCFGVLSSASHCCVVLCCDVLCLAVQLQALEALLEQCPG